MASGKPIAIGLVLAGGLSRRMGGQEKAFIELAGRPLIAHVIDRLIPQLPHLVLNANGDPARFDRFGYPVIADRIAGNAGPLAGILAGLEWAAAHAPDYPFVLSAPADTPFLPQDLARRLIEARQEQKAELACAASGGRIHPVVALWPVSLRAALAHAITVESERKVDRWTSRFAVAKAEFSNRPIDPFFNINAPEDLEEAARLLEPDPFASD